MAVAAEAELNIDPSLERARELAAEGNAIPIRLSFVDDCETPVSAFLKLRGEGPCFLLESAEQGRLGRYSFLGFNPRAVLRWSNGRLEAWAGERLSGEPASEVEAPDPYLAVSDYIGGFKVPPVEDLPAFAGGAVGFFGYDLVRTIEPLGEPNPDPIGLPDMALMVSDLLVVFDHMRHELTLMSYAFVEGEDDLQAAYARAAGAIVAARDRLRGPVPRSPVMREPGEAPAFESNMSREQFEDNVRRIGRNDLGRVCEYGSVKVDELMVVEAYSHVLHIVSQVSGTLRPGVTAMDALRAVLPAGTLSGAPTVRAMQIIDELEPHKRGSYGGAIGYVGFTGDLDTAIHIRTVVVKDGLVHVQAGGGTVADAKPDYEFAESVNKAKAVFAAVDLAASQPEWP